MANRPFFSPKNNLVFQYNIDFKWISGTTLPNQQRCVASFHEAIKEKNFKPLEVSTKSTSPLGRKLSAFNLKIGDHYLENVFQSSKVFTHGGPYLDLLEVEPKAAKKDPRLHDSGALLAFRYESVDWPLNPKTVFYDWIYYNAVRKTLTAQDLEELKEYDAFTDIVFNPEKSINTQARSIAFVVLIDRMYEGLPEFKPDEFIELHKKLVRY